MKTPKRLLHVEKILAELPPSERTPGVYRAIAKAAKIKESMVNDRLKLAEMFGSRPKKHRRKQNPFAASGIGE